MKMKHLLFIGAGFFAIMMASVCANAQTVITTENFGSTLYDTGTNGTPGSHTNGTNTYWWWSEVTTFSSSNGHIEGGLDNSVRINNYLAPTANQTYSNASQGCGICVHGPSSYTGGIWSQVIYKAINITGYENLTIGFGFAKRANFGADANSTRLSLKYSIDGGTAVDGDLSSIPVPLALGTWVWATVPVTGTGTSMEITFTSPQGDAFMLDDISVTGTSTPTSLASASNKGKISVSPNPVINNLTVKGYAANAEYEIVSITGTSVLKGKLANGNIDLSKLNKGIYFLSVKSDGKTKTNKIIKN
jgi:hypothetical protein